MTERTLTRRLTLGLTGSAIAAGLAGCVTGGSGQLTNTENTAADDERSIHNDADDGDHDADDGDHDADDGDHDHDVDHELGHPEAHVEVTMESDDDGHHFVPHVVHVEPGGTVTWVLDSGVHDTVAYHPANASVLPSAAEQRIPDDGDPWASDVYDAAGETYELTFEREGIFDYTCTIAGHGHRPHHGGGHHDPHPTHESTGMVGRVIVGEPDLDPDEQPALRPPAAELPETARQELDGFNERTRATLAGDGH